jgi:hypothetical protein
LKNTRWLGLGIGLSLLLATSAVAAQDREFVLESLENRVGMEIDWLHTVQLGGSINIVTWDLTVQIGVTPNLFIDVDVPWAFASYPGSRDRGVFGNPLIGLHYAAALSRSVGFFAGGFLGIPVNADPSVAGIFTDELVKRIRADAGRARFEPRAFPLGFRGGIEISSAPFFARFDLAPTFLAGLGGNDTVVVLDQGNEVGFRARRGYLGGVRLQTNFILTNAADRAQFALEPFVGYEAAFSGLFLRFGLLVALDEELGFGLDRGKNAIGRFLIGGKF